jgi:hypothetical protein
MSSSSSELMVSKLSRVLALNGENAWITKDILDYFTGQFERNNGSVFLSAIDAGFLVGQFGRQDDKNSLQYLLGLKERLPEYVRSIAFIFLDHSKTWVYCKVKLQDDMVCAATIFNPHDIRLEHDNYDKEMACVKS